MVILAHQTEFHWTHRSTDSQHLKIILPIHFFARFNIPSFYSPIWNHWHRLYLSDLMSCFPATVKHDSGISNSNLLLSI